ncbi:uncharacterized protein AMSG_03414 [Thecamonas trahens ATCC 50062]|uniref:DUF294 domain-containing protein n=1 Tax=Thecamonas trahens ATCC 50062 TaxID=461836 RepID=A0A0L0D3R3_THETB|nr:hypothetical protein AMSG_03414 [Thecamonas trahens ATCC 50062]KNC46982.1 hypothetical protein AMSG_03414 [Thecamonas trahens ATCC 50062]|eukprot:XP_013760251.1 hypothetical protein AMSG_03414 [Thecamonas trahens ATCC 50062]
MASPAAVPLADFIESHPLPLARACVFAQLAAALAALHASGRAHGSLGPDAVVVNNATGDVHVVPPLDTYSVPHPADLVALTALTETPDGLTASDIVAEIVSSLDNPLDMLAVLRACFSGECPADLAPCLPLGDLFLPLVKAWLASDASRAIREHLVEDLCGSLVDDALMRLDTAHASLTAIFAALARCLTRAIIPFELAANVNDGAVSMPILVLACKLSSHAALSSLPTIRRLRAYFLALEGEHLGALAVSALALSISRGYLSSTRLAALFISEAVTILDSLLADAVDTAPINSDATSVRDLDMAAPNSLLLVVTEAAFTSVLSHYVSAAVTNPVPLSLTTLSLSLVPSVLTSPAELHTAFDRLLFMTHTMIRLHRFDSAASVLDAASELVTAYPELASQSSCLAAERARLRDDDVAAAAAAELAAAEVREHRGILSFIRAATALVAGGELSGCSLLHDPLPDVLPPYYLRKVATRLDSLPLDDELAAVLAGPLDVASFVVSVLQAPALQASVAGPRGAFIVHDVFHALAMAFLELLLEKATLILGIPPSAFTLVGLGSVARGEMAPFSDLDIVFLVEPDIVLAPECPSLPAGGRDDYFLRLAHLLELFLLTVGETGYQLGPVSSWSPRGFRLDEAALSPLVTRATPASLVAKQRRELISLLTPPLDSDYLDPIAHSLRTAAYIAGDANLFTSYKKALDAFFDRRLMATLVETEAGVAVCEDAALALHPDTPVRRAYALLALAKNTGAERTFSPWLVDRALLVPDAEVTVDVKTDLQRFPMLLVDGLALFFGVSAVSTLARLDALYDAGVFNVAVRDALVHAFGFALGLRMVAQLARGEENDVLLPSMATPKLVAEIRELVAKVLCPIQTMASHFVTGMIETLARESKPVFEPGTLVRLPFRDLGYLTETRWRASLDDISDVMYSFGQLDPNAVYTGFGLGMGSVTSWCSLGISAHRAEMPRWRDFLDSRDAFCAAAAAEDNGAYFYSACSDEVRKLRPDAVAQLFSGSTVTRAYDHGVRAVATVGNFHFKLDPELPAMELAVHVIGRVLFRGNRTNASPHPGGTPRVDVIKLYFGAEAHYFLVSETVAGPTLKQLWASAGHNVENYDAALSRVDTPISYDPFSFTQQVLLALVTNPEDGKEDNYVCEAVDPEQLAYRIVPIDNDHSFVSAVTKSGFFSKRIPRLKCILFCMQEMHDAVDADLRDYMLYSVHADALLDVWVDVLEAIDARMASFELPHVRKDMADTEGKPTLDVLFKPGLVHVLYHKITLIQEVLRGSRVTHMQLLGAVEHELMTLYARAFQEAMNPWARFHLLTESQYKRGRRGLVTLTPSLVVRREQQCRVVTTADERTSSLWADLTMVSPADLRSELNDLAHEQADAAVTALFSRSDLRPFRALRLPLFKEAFVERLNFGLFSFPAKLQREVLKALVGTLFRKLVLAHCVELDDKSLARIIGRCDHLQWLDVSYCSKLVTVGSVAKLAAASICRLDLRGCANVPLAVVVDIEARCRSLSYLALPEQLGAGLLDAEHHVPLDPRFFLHGQPDLVWSQLEPRLQFGLSLLVPPQALTQLNKYAKRLRMDLSGADLRDPIVRNVAKVLPHTSAVVSVNIAWNRVSGPVLVELAQAFAANPLIFACDISFNGPAAPDELAALADVDAALATTNALELEAVGEDLDALAKLRLRNLVWNGLADSYHNSLCRKLLRDRSPHLLYKSLAFKRVAQFGFSLPAPVTTALELVDGRIVLGMTNGSCVVYRPPSDLPPTSAVTEVLSPEEVAERASAQASRGAAASAHAVAVGPFPGYDSPVTAVAESDRGALLVGTAAGDVLVLQVVARDPRSGEVIKWHLVRTLDRSTYVRSSAGSAGGAPSDEHPIGRRDPTVKALVALPKKRVLVLIEGSVLDYKTSTGARVALKADPSLPALAQYRFAEFGELIHALAPLADWRMVTASAKSVVVWLLLADGTGWSLVASAKLGGVTHLAILPNQRISALACGERGEPLRVVTLALDSDASLPKLVQIQEMPAPGTATPRGLCVSGSGLLASHWAGAAGNPARLTLWDSREKPFMVQAAQSRRVLRDTSAAAASRGAGDTVNVHHEQGLIPVLALDVPDDSSFLLVSRLAPVIYELDVSSLALWALRGANA